MKLTDRAIAMLDNPRVFAVLGTARKHGSPQVNPMWIDREGATPTFNSALGRAKTKQIERDPRVTLTLLDLDDPYRYVELRGRVARTVTGQEAEDHIDRLAKKYIDKDVYPWRREGQHRVKYFFEPEWSSDT
jgi:PPOX class probable F420-dependent enzyme